MTLKVIEMTRIDNCYNYMITWIAIEGKGGRNGEKAPIKSFTS